MSLHLSAFGPAKVILLGEHGVVFGHAALAAPLSRGVRAWGEPSRTCELEMPEGLSKLQMQALERAFAAGAKAARHPKIRIHLESEVPVSMGLGSSAALSVAVAKVLLGGSVAPAPQKVLRVAMAMEREFHGTPSGIDHTTSALDSLIWFRKGQAKKIVSPKPLRLLVTLVGERSPAREIIESFRTRASRYKGRYNRVLGEIGRLADEGRRSIQKGDLEGLGDAMNVNHGLLCALGLSSESLDSMVYRLRSMGALGAKITGAGGDGGAVIGLFSEPEPALVRLQRQGVDCFVSQVAGPRAL